MTVNLPGDGSLDCAGESLAAVLKAMYKAETGHAAKYHDLTLVSKKISCLIVTALLVRGEYAKVTVKLQTHRVLVVTLSDIELARQIDEVVCWHGIQSLPVTYVTTLLTCARVKTGKMREARWGPGFRSSNEVMNSAVSNGPFLLEARNG